ncbi:MAG: hypothetical protein HC929_16380 [Leptolyngbyaceae cyanobacterium SM2_5_2]|nr:hypothetical protein [Leptolyngbyaceae cyanobacterium SM2_5_2]
MVSTPAAVTPTVRLLGPFWQADVEVLQLTSPRQNLAFRSLWLEQRATGTAGELLYLPGTAILLGCVRRVTVTPAPGQDYRWQRQAPAPAAETPAEIRTALGTGELALLLVQVDPTRWPSLSELGSVANPQNLPPTTCLAGDIALDTFLSPVNNATSRLYDALDIEPVADVQLIERRGVTRQRSPLTVHSSGLSLYGRIDLPWEAERLPASLQLAQTFGPSASNPAQIQPGPFRLSLEVERLIPTEHQAWVDAWRHLSQYLTPRNPLNGLSRAVETTSPHWVTLEITNPTAIPNLFWAIDVWAQGRDLTFSNDSFSLIFSNQSPYDLEVPPTSLARVSGMVRMSRLGNGHITLNLTAGVEIADQHYAYRYRVADATTTVPPTETITLSNLTLAFDPVQVPQFLRERQGQPVPASTAEAVDPPVLWGFMPLERGWFNYPYPT